ncbi:MAG TPA: alpha/beta fold hydrolase [Roseiarcus sp.]|nr:alpha/beta fold hydrolase [Roseiarcus sp.]
MSFAKANAIEIAYEDQGEAGAPVILLIMGLGASLIFWPDAFVDGLAARGFRVVRFDNRDFGLSTKFDGLAADVEGAYARRMKGEKIEAPYGLPDMAEDAIGLLDALHIDRAHIVGASMGGMIGQIIAADHKDRVKSLVSIMSTSGDPNLPQGKPEAMAVLTLPPPPAEDRAANIEHGVKCQRVIGSPVIPTSEAELRTRVARGYDRSNYYAGVPRQLVAVIANGSRVELLRRITTPTLVIHGTDDPLIPPEGGKDTAAHIPGADLMLVPGMGHDFPAPLIETLVGAIARHYRKAEAAGAR